MIFARLTSLIVAGLTTVSVLAAPMFDQDLGKTSVAKSSSIERRSAQAPHFVIYADAWQAGVNGPPPAASVDGYNVFALSFFLTKGPLDKAAEWQALTADQRAAVKAEYAAAGISLVVSAFGGTEKPTTDGIDPIAMANTLSAFVKDTGLDGIDIDYEDLPAMDKADGSAEAWLISFTKQLRVNLPQGEYILTHAPLAPWFSPGKYASGAYTKVHAEVGALIDWYNIQFYNQGTTEYTTCEGLMTASSSAWPGTSIGELVASGIPAEKVVLGKPATTADATTGLVDAATLATCVAQGAASGWNGGVMAWQYPNADSAWIKTVRGTTF